MSRYTYPTASIVGGEVIFFNEGDLVETIMGQIGIVVGHGPHPHNLYFLGNPKTLYYKVLIQETVYYFIAGALKKKKN